MEQSVVRKNNIKITPEQIENCAVWNTQGCKTYIISSLYGRAFIEADNLFPTSHWVCFKKCTSDIDRNIVTLYFGTEKTLREEDKYKDQLETINVPVCAIEFSFPDQYRIFKVETEYNWEDQGDSYYGWMISADIFGVKLNVHLVEKGEDNV